MAGFIRKTRYLTCFYCNRRTSTRQHEGIRRFECPHCQETNWLDENGDPDDPPIEATVHDRPPVRFAAAPRAPVSPVSSQSGNQATANSVFCPKCLSNQQIVRDIMAEYLPDESDPGYAAAMRGLYAYRRKQEANFPQICAECEPKVRARLDQASYTAKTDLLRRMIERTNESRQVKKRGALDHVNAVGGWLWMTGMMLQFCWHATVLAKLLPMCTDAPSELPASLRSVLVTCARISETLPAPRRLVNWSLAASLLSVWWNPRFVHVWRGFSRHILGLPTWYTYQVMAIVVKIVVSRMLLLEDLDLASLNMQVAGHLFTVGFTFYMYRMAPRAIHTDTTPLFRTPTKQPPLRPEPLPEDQEDDGNMSMAQILNEILRSPPQRSSSPVSPSSPVQRPVRKSTNGNLFSQNSSTTFQSNPRRDVSNATTLAPAPVQDADMMDWSPTQSPYRAFNTFGQRQGQAFGAAPVAEKSNPFWYKVPPAPTTPAQRVFNPPNQPRLRPNAAALTAPQSKFAFGRREEAAAVSSALVRRRDSQESLGSQGSHEEDEGASYASRKPVTFAQPKFFPPEAQNDPRNSLANMFGESFSLSQEEREQQKKASWFGESLFGMGSGRKENK